jgi:diguanylate cyclase (GGDEF)-like protein
MQDDPASHQISVLDAISWMVEDDTAPCSQASSLPDWKLLIVDDDVHVQQVTELVLRGLKFLGRGMHLLHAHSAEEARSVLQDHRDIAFALLDVVMETPQAGLDLVRHIRDELGERAMRIVLRTGQPGDAPEQEVVLAYEIDDYKAKTELSAQKLTTCVIAGLRAHHYITRLNELNAELEMRVQSRTAELEKLAMLDPLTGAGNRRHLEQRASVEIADSERHASPLAVVLLDIDHFKKINDTWSHAAGDAVLCRLVSLVQGELRPRDFLARIGGEEFVLLLPGSGLDDGGKVCERIRRCISCAPFETGQGEIAVTSSFGVTVLAPGEQLEAVLARADGALYAAKQGGRNRVIAAELPGLASVAA